MRSGRSILAEELDTERAPLEKRDAYGAQVGLVLVGDVATSAAALDPRNGGLCRHGAST
jgi:hypothetical protein